jgi:hypothetical protein
VCVWFQHAEKTDDDFQVDDMFVFKAAQQQSGARNEEKERSKAIFGMCVHVCVYGRELRTQNFFIQEISLGPKDLNYN